MCRILLSLTALVCAAGCAPKAPLATVQKTELYFGRAMPDGKEISDANWESFSVGLGKCFPLGYSVLDGWGHWRGNDGSDVRERSKIAVAVHAGTIEVHQCIDSLKEEYKHRFSQEAVMELTSPVDQKL